ncbi:MAG: GDSL-type esterase/lipase family protein [Deltaproteobacteria bacterium]|jgi:lysophospholipase L1-like esterase|nr:GDSL-type esterase/lipase family protein [Deltaproteobacteria bacterium]
MPEEQTIVMLGDSLTEFNVWDSLAPKARIVNLGLSGDTTMGIFFRLNLVVHQKPDLVFLQAGINDLSQGRTPLEVSENHEKIWQSLLSRVPWAKLLVCSLAPVREEKFCWDTEVLKNSRVRQANDLLIRKAQAHNLDYIDLYKALSDNNNELPDRFTDDGVHLTAAAYEVWLATLKNFLVN